MKLSIYEPQKVVAYEFLPSPFIFLTIDSVRRRVC